MAADETVETNRTVSVTPGQTWTAIAQARSAVPNIDACLYLALYDGETLLGTSDFTDTDYTPLSATWTDLTYTYVVPADGSVDGIRLGISFARVTGPPIPGGTVIEFRHVALEDVPATHARYFTGSAASTTGDHMWEGEVGNSRSHYYGRRVPKALRIKQLLQDFVPANTTLELLFGLADDLSGNERFGAGIGNYNPVEAVARPATVSLTVQWDRQLTWWDITNGYTDWDAVTAAFTTWSDLHGVPLVQWADVTGDYTDWAALTATGDTWADIALNG